MIGDNLMIYNPVKDAFYAGRGEKVYANRKATPLWEKDPAKAKCSNALIKYRAICTEVGEGARIVSETEARRIVMMREYREGNNGQIGAGQGEQAVLSEPWAMPELWRGKASDTRQDALRGMRREGAPA